MSKVTGLANGSSKLGMGIIFSLALLVVVYGVWTRNKDANDLQEKANNAAVPTVIVITAKSLQDENTLLDLPAKLEAFSKAPIYARVSGYLKSWHADIGARVKAGQLLAEIETPDLDQQLLQAQAELVSVKANAAMSTATAKRWQSLLDKNFVSEQALEEKNGDASVKQALVNASQANVERLKSMKNFSKITAPFDGVVTARSTDIGALINVGGAPGAELFTVSDISKLRVLVNVPQSMVALLQPGTKAKITVPEQPGKVYTAEVKSMAQAISMGSGTMLIQMMADNSKRELTAGGYAKVSFELPNLSGNLTIPPSALLMGKEGPRVATVDGENKVVIKKVQIARDSGYVIELASGISPTDRIIQSPPDGVLDGDLVKVSMPAIATGK